MKDYVQTFESFLNESLRSSERLLGTNFELSLTNIKKDGDDIVADGVMTFDDKNMIQPFIDNDLDRVNDEIRNLAAAKRMFKRTADYSLGFEEGTEIVSGNTVRGKFHFWSAQNESEDYTVLTQIRDEYAAVTGKPKNVNIEKAKVKAEGGKKVWKIPFKGKNDVITVDFIDKATIGDTVTIDFKSSTVVPFEIKLGAGEKGKWKMMDEAY